MGHQEGRQSGGFLFLAAVGVPVLFIGTLVGGLMIGLFGSNDADCDSGVDGTTNVRAPAGVGGLNPAQLSNASAIIAEGVRLHVPSKGIVIALATASQESHFSNYANDGRGGDLMSIQQGIQASLKLPHEAVGTDHGSLGVFQQQWPWWGTMKELMTPATAASKFYRALLKMPNWQDEPVTVAAQSVQSSAYPDAYADDEAIARQLLGLPKTAALPAAATSQVAASTDCADGGTDGGTVVFPLPRGSSYRDNHNFGGRGGHWASVHTGDDLSVACGTPVLAATAGTIIIRTDQPWAGPHLVQVSTGAGRLTTWYAHMRTVVVSAGTHVSAGQQIGEVGDLGNATGCHLHFEVHPHGGSIYQDDVDPSAWLKAHVGKKQDFLPVRGAAWSGSSDAFTVATFNVLGNSHTSRGGKAAGMASGPARMHGAVRILNRYGVDVVGLQELQGPQAHAFKRLAGATYALWWPRGESPENAIAYRRDRWSFVGAESVVIPYFNGRVRRMPVVRLQDRANRAQVTFVNVHNPADTRKFRHQSRWRNEAVRREIALVRGLSGHTPVILTGDLNDRRSAFCRLASAGGMASSAGGTGTPCRPPRHGGIDWILGSRSIGFSDHTVVRSQLVRATTDHPIVMARARAEH